MIKSKQIQRPKLVLVVDDQEINRDVLEGILGLDYEVITAENGSEALDLMRAHVNDLSLVLLDLMMPVMNGFEVLTFLQEQKDGLGQIPVIVLTAEKSAELKALQLGALDFITKPFDMPEVILARAGRIIELSEGRQLISAAEQDGLTNLYSRNFFMEYALRLYKYHPEMCPDAIVLNIEKFHSINALHGRDFGDYVLRVIGSEIRSFLAETEGIAGRFDADRFGIFCVRQPDYLLLLERFQNRVDLISENISIHLRMGIMPWRDNLEPVQLFDCARTACNMVRGDYQNPLMIYDEDMRLKELLNQRLLNDLRGATEEQQLLVYYQPQYSIRHNPPRLVGMEALIRWRHPELGMISPGEFVPLLEGNGLIGIVDNYVWREAARQVAKWRDDYGVTIPVSVNLSRSDVFEPSLVERLRQLILENGLDFSLFHLEVTESAYTDNANRLLEVIGQLRDIGFSIEMDDFGTGYSSLNRLSDMPFDVLKMDMKFIRNIEANPTDRRLVKLILDIARYLEVKVVAEGVETPGQLAILREGGCDVAQGYYFSRPLPAEEFTALIEKEKAAGLIGYP